MVAPKEKEVEKKELPKIVITKPPAAKLEIVPTKIAEEAMERTAKNAEILFGKTTDLYTAALKGTVGGQKLLGELKKGEFKLLFG